MKSIFKNLLRTFEPSNVRNDRLGREYRDLLIKESGGRFNLTVRALNCAQNEAGYGEDLTIESVIAHLRKIKQEESSLVA